MQLTLKVSPLLLLPTPPLSERRYCDARRHAVTLCVYRDYCGGHSHSVSAALVLAVKVMRCIQCSLVIIIVIIIIIIIITCSY